MRCDTRETTPINAKPIPRMTTVSLFVFLIDRFIDSPFMSLFLRLFPLASTHPVIIIHLL